MSGPTSFFLNVEWQEVSDAYRRAGLAPRIESPAHALARAIAASPGWREFPPGVVVLRPGPSPLLGILFSEPVTEPRSLQARAAHLPVSLEGLRFANWEEVQQDVHSLAGMLRAELSDDGMAHARWSAIPRGGSIVLGLLSYLLDVSVSTEAAGQGSPIHATGAEGPIVVVDDCVLSGRRLGEHLRVLGPDSQIVVATLFSSPGAREAILGREPRVRAFHSARDLRDRGEALFGSGQKAWRDRWTERSGPEAYWIGLPEHICFPWNEPDTGLWDGSREIRAWRVLPPSVCLKNRPRLGDSMDVWVMPEDSGYLEPAPGVISARLDGTMVIASRRGGACVRISDVAAAMWEAASSSPDRGAAADALVREFEIERSQALRDLESFERGMIDLGFLERRT